MKKLLSVVLAGVFVITVVAMLFCYQPVRSSDPGACCRTTCTYTWDCGYGIEYSGCSNLRQPGEGCADCTAGQPFPWCTFAGKSCQSSFVICEKEPQ